MEFSLEKSASCGRHSNRRIDNGSAVPSGSETLCRRPPALTAVPSRVGSCWQRMMAHWMVHGTC